MCHGTPCSRFPTPEEGAPLDSILAGFEYGEQTAPAVAILPDIYGCSPFYQGLATHLASKGLRVFLMNPFDALGELPEQTREAAFERRNKLHDRAYMDAFDKFINKHNVAGVIGFCLGGLYIFELVRRGYKGEMVALYPFPQGLPNQDALPTPFDYLPGVQTPHTVMVGGQDNSIGPDNVAGLKEVAKDNKAIQLTVYENSGHGFLGDLDSDDDDLRSNAEDAMARLEKAILKVKN